MLEDKKAFKNYLKTLMQLHKEDKRIGCKIEYNASIIIFHLNTANEDEKRNEISPSMTWTHGQKSLKIYR